MQKETFHLVHKTLKSKRYRINRDNLIGTNINCDIFVSGEGVSDKHCKLKLIDKGILVRSLNPEHLVKINGTPVFEAIAFANDRIEFSPTDIYQIQKLADGIRNDFILKSKNSNWQDQLSAIDAIANSDEPVIILGPSGTGKEELARIMHEKSNRRRGSLVCVNCSALSESLIESELFGHTKGSFTGAIADRKGAFQSARGGTLFLDEIGDLPLELQPKLLRALENGEIRPVGSDRTIKSDVRIIAATHQDLTQKIKHDEFREDLYFRLNILRLSPPPLTKRMEDFEDLLLYFCQKEEFKLNPKIIKLLKNHHWPGNIRELKNFVTRAAALFRDKEVNCHDLVKLVDDIDPRVVMDPHFTNFDVKNITMKEAEKKLITKGLMLNYGNQRQTAEQLGIPKSTLSDKVKHYGIDVKEIKKQSRKYIKGV